MKVELISAEEYELNDFQFDLSENREFVVFDLEGTGPDAEGDSVTQFGAVKMGNEAHAFESLVKPWKPIPPKVEELTGVTNERVGNAVRFSDAFERFREFCGDAVLVTQCGYEYDFPLLDSECEKAGIERFGNIRLDTKAIFALLHPDRRETFSTNFLSDYYRIDRSEFKRHDALSDAKLIAQIFEAELKEARQLGVHSLSPDCVRVKRFTLPSNSADQI